MSVEVVYEETGKNERSLAKSERRVEDSDPL